MKYRLLSIVLALGCCCFLSWGDVGVPTLLHYQGRLTDTNGLFSGNVSLVMRLFDAPQNGALLFEDSNTVTVVDGLWSAFIGDDPTLASGPLSEALGAPELYVEVVINGQPFARERLVSVPYALRAGLLPDFDRNNGYRANGPFAPPPQADGTHAIAMGVGARVDGVGGVVGGGSNNTIAVGTLFNTIAGGARNTIGPGSDNATIGGGWVNTIGGAADNSTISGGWGNTIQTNSDRAVVAGGWNNRIAAESRGVVIGGGRDNQVMYNGDYAVVSGGFGNKVFSNAMYAVIPGGYDNEVAGSYGFAAGCQAKVDHPGAFVWADAADTVFRSTAPNQFLIRAAGGVGIGTAAPDAPLTVAGIVHSTAGGIKFPDGTLQSTAASGGGVGLSLPYRGSFTEPDGVLCITNNGGPALQGIGEGRSSGSRYGVEGIAWTWVGNAYGLRGDASASAGTAYGVYGRAANGNGAAFAVYGMNVDGPYGYLGGKTYALYGWGDAALENGHLGIGRAPGADRVTVAGNLLVQDSVTGKSLRLRTTGDALDFDISNHNLWVNGDGNNIMVIHNARRNVGIGATDPASNAKLDVRNANSGYALRVESTASDGTAILAVGGPNGNAADFRGNVRLFRRSDNAMVVELGEGLDYAEGFAVTEPAEVVPGAVLVIDADNPGALTLSRQAYDTRVAGIAAGARGLGSGVRLGSPEFDVDVALAGRVYCNVDATEAAVEPGDLLTTSGTPGHAMKAVDRERTRGAVLGKAMERIEQGKRGQILVLVCLQ